MFILAAKFNDTYSFDMYPNVGTDYGICKTIKPMVSLYSVSFVSFSVNYSIRLTLENISKRPNTRMNSSYQEEKV